MKAEWMAVVHDMGEAVIGDIAPGDGISPGKIPKTVSLSNRVTFNEQYINDK